RMATPLQWTDPRTTPGELLWPQLFPIETVVDLETRLGPYAVACQLQQRPVPESCGLFKRDWFRLVDATPSDAPIVARCRFWDCAATEEDGCYTVGVLMAQTKDGRFSIEHVVRGRWGPSQFEGRQGILRQTADMDKARVGFVRIREEQEGGSAGKRVVAAHAQVLVGFDFRGDHPTGDKVTRARPFASQAAMGNVLLVKGPW